MKSEWPISRAEWFLQRMLGGMAPEECEVLGRRYRVLRGVFSPALSKSTEFFARFLTEICKGKSVLEIGCGSGAVSISCAFSGAKQVTCSDLSSRAIECTEQNLARHNIGQQVRTVHCAGFGSIKGRFDIIFFALPYILVADIEPHRATYGDLAYSVFDQDYDAQLSFLRSSPKYVKKNGRVFVGFSKIGDGTKFDMNVRSVNARARLMRKEKEGRADNRIYEISYGELGRAWRARFGPI